MRNVLRARELERSVSKISKSAISSQYDLITTEPHWKAKIPQSIRATIEELTHRKSTVTPRKSRLSNSLQVEDDLLDHYDPAERILIHYMSQKVTLLPNGVVRDLCNV